MANGRRGRNVFRLRPTADCNFAAQPSKNPTLSADPAVRLTDRTTHAQCSGQGGQRRVLRKPLPRQAFGDIFAARKRDRTLWHGACNLRDCLAKWSAPIGATGEGVPDLVGSCKPDSTGRASDLLAVARGKKPHGQLYHLMQLR